MSVSSDFWDGHEPKPSSALRLASSFRRASTTSTAQDSQKNEKRGPGSLTSIGPPRRPSLVDLPLRLLRSRTKTTEVVQDENEQQTSRRNRLGDIFFAMPNEIQVQILCYLDASDMLSLRITSKRVFELLQINASVISRLVLRNGTLGDDLIHEGIYRPPQPVWNLNHFLQMMHRERVVMQMVSTIADYVQTKIYQVKSASRRKQFAPSRSRMEKRLKVSAFITYHFLEKFRSDLLRHMERASSSSSKTSLSDLGSVDVDIQTRIINGYPEDALLPAFQFYRIMVSAYRQKLRPPTYAGTIERKIRGWDRTPASDADVAQVLIYGGMEEVLKIMLHPTYGARLQALNLTIDHINGRSLPVGSTWMEGKSKPKVIRDLDIPPISDIQFMSQGSTAKLTTLYLPWLWAIVAKRRAAEGTESSAPDPQIPSPFAYIEDLLKDHESDAIPGGIGVTVENFAARANAPDEDEEHTNETAAGPADTLQGALTQHRSLSFPTQYG